MERDELGLVVFVTDHVVLVTSTCGTVSVVVLETLVSGIGKPVGYFVTTVGVTVGEIVGFLEVSGVSNG